LETETNPYPVAAALLQRENGTSVLAPRTVRVRKVCFLVDSLRVGGTEVQAVELARRLDPTRYRVTLACLRARGPLLEKLRDSAISVSEFYPQGGVDSPRGIYQLVRFARFLRRERFDIFHSHDLWSNLMGIPAAWLARVPVIISSRRDLAPFDWYQTRRRPWLRRIQSLSTTVVVNAAAIRDQLIEEEDWPAQKVRVIHNGIEVGQFANAPHDRERLFPGTAGNKLIVMVGNMHSDVKGHAYLIAAAPSVLREFSRTRFVLVGDGEKRIQFQRQVAERGLESSFIFFGSRRDVPEILASCDIGVLPSIAEGLSNALLEYLAAGLPVVASRVGGNREIVDHEQTGLLVPAQAPESLAAAILQLLRDPEKARALARRGQDYVRRNFSFEHLLSDVDALYVELLTQRKGSA